MMYLEKAEKIAAEVVEELTPYCSRIKVAGSIRRGRKWVNDIDFVLIPSNQGQLWAQILKMGKVIMGGKKVIRCHLKSGASLDIYIADEKTWATLLLIRTGSANHNKKLCSRARNMYNMTLKADGSGLFYLSDPEQRIAGDTEESIFKALGMEYVRPELRE